MKYISELHIDTFKGIENLNLSNCGDVNIIVGDNNTCKTSVLEAIQFFQFPNNFKDMIRISRKRDIASRIPKSITVLESFLNIFNAKQDDKKEISMKCRTSNSEKLLKIVGEVKDVYVTDYELQEMSKYKRIKKELISEETPVKEFRGNIYFNERTAEVFINEITDIYRYASDIEQEKEPVFKMKYVSSIDHINENFSIGVIVEAVKQGDKSGLLELINMFDNNIIGIEILPNRNDFRPTIYIKHKEYGFLPITSFGDGLKKVLALAGAILSINNGILLIDEIETAIHTSALSEVFKWLLKVCKAQNVQIFATTHSDEALKNFLLNYKVYELDANVYRLEVNEGKTIARRFSGDKASKIIIGNGGDLR